MHVARSEFHPRGSATAFLASTYGEDIVVDDVHDDQVDEVYVYEEDVEDEVVNIGYSSFCADNDGCCFRR